MDQLKQRILKCWDEIPQETVDRTIDGFRKRVKKMIEVEGRQRVSQLHFICMFVKSLKVTVIFEIVLKLLM